MREIIDPKMYTGYNLLNDVFHGIQSIDSKHPWREFITELQSLPKRTTGIDSWFYVMSRNNEITFETSHAPIAPINEVNNSRNNADWLLITFHDNGLELTNSVKTRYQTVLDKILNLPGMIVSAIHYIGSNAVIAEHIDAHHLPKYSDNGFYNILLTISTSTTNKEDIAIIINGNRYNIPEGQVFAFDAQFPHSVENFSNGDWVVLTIRVDKKYFNYENIIT